MTCGQFSTRPDVCSDLMVSCWSPFRRARVSLRVGAGYRMLGHDVTLVRFHRTADQVTRLLQTAGFLEAARMVRDPLGGERHDQAVVIARLGDLCLG